ncbi:addiction module antidote protein, HigA family [Pleurocapsa sp. CCALA 161]|uniref:helix-turn-helix domain-containing protein n=1 Tax=Pleurocapsa sp. CCALA 161 TaxID=2107688 RepID=UPI000D0600D5|nr:helix-turn-helix domain-containing protein [Pleurocapsa sp. CCALA 161]PSB10638.1 addiction module antidote protein, HigA family [Pleurocapsa sp. CCALA 161]
MSNTLTPARAISPGRILQRELDARAWTQKDLAEITNRPAQTINEIIKGTKQITPETARELSAALGTTAEFWTNLETNYRLNLAKKKQKEEEIERRSRLYTLAPISELIKRGWIKSTESLDELEQSVCQFLGIKSPQESTQFSVNFRKGASPESNSGACVARHSEMLEPEHNAKIAWCKRVEQVGSKQTLGEFQLDKLTEAIPNILSCAEKEEDVAHVPQMLIDLGVHFAIVPHLNKTYLDGAAFYLGNHPVIALTLRHNRIDCFWFSLMHELGHIVAGHRGVYLDNLDELEKNSEEEEANQLARNWLIDEQALNSFVVETQPKFSKKAITNFAQAQKRHPGIILGRLQHENLVPYQNLRVLLTKVKPFLSDWIYD